jgi:hypothetical protein
MSKLAWDRLLETAHVHKADLLLVPGSPPLLRMPSHLRSLSVPVLDDQDVISLAREMFSTGASGDGDGYTWFDSRYLHDTNDWFRLMAFGYPQTKFLMVIHIPPATPGESA